MHRAGAKISPTDSRLIDALSMPGAFDDTVNSVEVIETHISWVILTDDYAYKIKKPIVLDFLDFGDLDKRRFYCEEEIRLNQPWAPEIYLDVIAITDDGGQPRFGGSGETIEYAVRMRRFDDDLRLDRQLELDRLSVADMRELGHAIAARHAAAPIAGADTREHFVALTETFMRDNFAALDGFVDARKLSRLSDWTEREIGKFDSLLGGRFDDGFVRDCHGDLHLGNLVRLADGITTFDCIEFNDDLRKIDVIADIAFLVMDLVAKQRHELAAHFLNRYLERTGDYAGVALLDLYFVYRCLVRAKVAVIRSQESDDNDERSANLEAGERYCDIALRQISKSRPVLAMMMGLSGSGKTWVSAQIMGLLPAIRMRSDIERKRLFGLGETERSGSDVGEGIYSPAASRDVYAHLISMARVVLDSGHNLILDAAFLEKAQREQALRVAGDCGCAAVIVPVEAPLEVMRDRIRQREASSADASEAGLVVLDHQLAAAEPLSAAERRQAVICDNGGYTDIPALVDAIRDCRYTVITDP